MFQRTLIAAALALASASAFAAAEAYTIDGSHTQTVFTWNHFGYSNPSANFDRIEGTITYDPADVSKSSVDVTIAIDSVYTHVPKLDTHMKGADMFDAARFPTATFKSTSVEKGSAEGTFKVTGDLTIHGVTKPVVLDARLNRAGEHPMKKIPTIGFDASTTIKRSDYGIDFMVPSVSDEIRIKITTEAALPKAAAK